MRAWDCPRARCPVLSFGVGLLINWPYHLVSVISSFHLCGLGAIFWHFLKLYPAPFLQKVALLRAGKCVSSILFSDLFESWLWWLSSAFDRASQLENSILRIRQKVTVGSCGSWGPQLHEATEQWSHRSGD